MAVKTTKRQNLKTEGDGKVRKSGPVKSNRKVAAASGEKQANAPQPAKADGARAALKSAKKTKTAKLDNLNAKKPRLSKRARAVVAADFPESAKRTLQFERKGLADLQAALSGPMAQPFSRAVTLLNAATGRVIVTGIGKSGHIGQKIAATFSSTGTTAFFVHPSEASHGDLGMISGDDAILALSWSGETVELGNILTHSRRFAVPLIALTSRLDSALGKAADVVLQLPKAPEACPHGLAPTTSTTMTLALGDCLAIALLEAKGFTAEDFKRIHPGGSLGAQLKYVEDVMHDARDLPLVAQSMPMSEAIVIMTQKAFGCLGVINAKGKLVGVITDGDLRRHMGDDLLMASSSAIMTRNPKTIRPDLLASGALEQLNAARITALFVVDKGVPVGIVHIHDLLRAGLG